MGNTEGPPRRQGLLSRLFNDETTPEEARAEVERVARRRVPTEPNRYKRAFVALLAKLNALALRLRSGKEASCALAVIVRIDPPAPLGVADEEPFGIASEVNVVACERDATLIGRRAYVIAEPDEDGTLDVAFADGSIESFSTGSEKGTVAEVEPVLNNARRAALSYDSRITECVIPDGLDASTGSTVRVSRANGMILGVARELPTWEIATVTNIIDGGLFEVSIREQTRVLTASETAGAPEVGHRVGIDASWSVILRDFGAEDNRFQLLDETGVTFDDIFGHEEAKAQLQDSVLDPLDDPDVDAHYRVKPIRGGLLIGPPGCGKTELGRATATELARIHRGRHPGVAVPVGFLYVNAAEVFEHLVGKAEKTVRSWGAWGRKFLARYGYRPIIFIDEIDAIGRKRGTGISTDAPDSIITAFLGLTGGMRDPGAIFLAATNRPDILDSAMFRDGRFDWKFVIRRPTKFDGEGIFAIHLRKTAVAPGSTVADLASAAAAELYDPKYAYYEIEQPPKEGEAAKPHLTQFTFGDLASGAMIAGIVQAAARTARKRDKTARKLDPKAPLTGVTVDDLRRAIADKFEENRPLNHEDELQEFLSGRSIERGRIRKLRQAAGPAT